MSDFTGSNAEMVNIVHTSPSMYIVFRSYFLQMHLYANIIIVVIFQKENDKLEGLMEKDMSKVNKHLAVYCVHTPEIKP